MLCLARARQTDDALTRLLVLRAVDLHDFPVIQAYRSQLAAPDAAGIERDEVGAHHQSQRRPVPGHDSHVGRASARYIEPGHEAGRRFPGAVLGMEIHGAVGAAEADAGQRIDDAAQAVGALQAVVPARRLVAIHAAQEVFPVWAAQGGFHLLRQRQRLIGRPLRQQAGMHHQIIALAQGKRPVPQPVKQFGAVGRGQDVIQRIAAAGLADADGHGKQMQVMVTEHHLRPVAQFAHHAQHGQGLRAAVDGVADEDEAGVGSAGSELVDQVDGACVAALDVADGVGGHK
jgi:hypothetical protein